MLCASLMHAEQPKMKQATGTVFRSKGQIQTGSSSRIELELPYLAIVRIGSNAAVEFSADNRTLTMDSGTLLLSSPKDTGKVTINSGSVITTVANGDLEMSNIAGQVKVIVLNGRVLASIAANPSSSKSLRSGQMVNVPAGATVMPPVTAIRLSKLLKTSILFNMGPLPSSKAIQQKATAQSPPRPFVTGGFDPDFVNGGLLSIGAQGTASMIARMEANAFVAPPVLAPNVIPTQAQLVEFEEAGVAVPRSNERALQQNQGRPATVPNQTPRPQATPRPPGRPDQGLPPIRPGRPDRPNQGLPVRPPIFRPPIAPPQ